MDIGGFNVESFVSLLMNGRFWGFWVIGMIDISWAISEFIWGCYIEIRTFN